ncbi:MAG: hypothetical protein EHM28_02565 [Spirochaetaceae bacterium]|nr:MAG: hypothetical protein EHM28_02565 [Spirochaetaceae bacterium]
MKRMIAAILFLLLAAGLVYAWKPNTHMYIVNVVIDDARDGKVTLVLPNGTAKAYDIDPGYLQVLSNTANDPFIRAGSIGPDGFPDIFTGQAVIHPDNTDAWLLHLKNRGETGFAARQDVTAFYLGYFMHCIGDMWAHDWVNYYAGGSYPGVTDFYNRTAASMQNAARHMAIEAALDNILAKSNPSMARTVDIPNDYMFDVITSTTQVLYMRQNTETNKSMDVRVEMFKPLKVLVELYWTMAEKKNAATISLSMYEREWHKDLESGLAAWVTANENAMKRVAGGEGMLAALKDEYKTWALNNLLSMAGFPDVVGQYVLLSSILTDKAMQILKAMGLTELQETLSQLSDSFADWAMRSITKNGLDAWKQIFMATVTRELFDEATYNRIMAEVAMIPAQSAFNHSRKDESMNALVYNSIVVSKLALLSSQQLNDFLKEMHSQITLDAGDFIPNGIYSIDRSGQFYSGTFGKIFGEGKITGMLRTNYASAGFTDPKVGPARISEKISSVMVTVKTKDSFGAGTDADIYLGMAFSDQTTKEWLLDRTAYNDFEKGDQDDYACNVTGNLYRTRVTRIWIRMGSHHGAGNEWDCSWMSLKINGTQVLRRDINKTFKNVNDKWETAVSGL